MTGAPLPSFEVHEGRGPHLLLLHGFLSSRAQWTPNLAALSEFCTPVVVELYGHGRSPSPEDPSRYSVPAYLDALERIREHLGAQQWFVCGYSLGAAITIRYALTHPDRLYGHVFTNSSSAFAAPELVDVWTRNAQQSAQRIRAGGMAAIEAIDVHPRKARRLPADVHEALLADARLIDPNGIANTLLGTMPTASVRLDIHGNTVPALLACGRFEKRFADHRSFAEATMPELSICDLDAGHAVNMEDTDAFNRAVEEFITTHGQ